MSVNILNDGGFIDPSVKIIGSGTLHIGKNAEIRSFTVIELSNGIINIGENSVIGYHSMIQATGSFIIGKGSLLGPHCVYVTSSHPINNKPLVGQGLIRGEIKIGNNVWVGANCTINTNIIINHNAVIGANSFVNKSIPGEEIWAGVPVKYIRKR